MAQLTERQRKELDEYLLEKREMITAGGLTTSDLTEWIRENLKFAVDTSNITHRVGPNGKLYKFEWEGSERSRKGRLSGKKLINVLVEQVNSLRVFCVNAYRELAALGMSLPPPVSQAEWDEVRRQADADLQDTDQREPEER